MEEIPEKIEQEFEIDKSPMREAYVLLEANTPSELSQRYTEEDQEFMKSNEWDYQNHELIINKVKVILEEINESELTEDEKEWRSEILWFWYHHATSCAIFKYKNLDAAKAYVNKALEYQSGDHPNQITRVLKLLLDGQIQEAKDFSETISDKVEKETACDFIKEFENGI